MTHPWCIGEVNSASTGRFRCFRNPPVAWRIFLVSGVLAVPGFLVGAMASLFLGPFFIGSFVGALSFALAGALMEAWPMLPRAFFPRRSVASDRVLRQPPLICFNRGGAAAIE